MRSLIKPWRMLPASTLRRDYASFAYRLSRIAAISNENAFCKHYFLGKKRGMEEKITWQWVVGSPSFHYTSPTWDFYRQMRHQRRKLHCSRWLPQHIRYPFQKAHTHCWISQLPTQFRPRSVSVIDKSTWNILTHKYRSWMVKVLKRTISDVEGAIL